MKKLIQLILLTSLITLPMIGFSGTYGKIKVVFINKTGDVCYFGGSTTNYMERDGDVSSPIQSGETRNIFFKNHRHKHEKKLDEFWVKMSYTCGGKDINIQFQKNKARFLNLKLDFDVNYFDIFDTKMGLFNTIRFKVKHV